MVLPIILLIKVLLFCIVLRQNCKSNILFWLLGLLAIIVFLKEVNMNYKELKDKINEVKWGVHISRLKNLPTSNVYLLPNNDWETNKLGNKVVIHRSSVYLSTISQDDFNRQFKLGQQLAEDGSIAIDSSLVSTFDFNQIKICSLLSNQLFIQMISA